MILPKAAIVPLRAVCQHVYVLRSIWNARTVLAAVLFILCAWTSTLAAEKRTFDARSAELVSGTSTVIDATASAGSLAGLAEPGQGVKLSGLPAAKTLAIRYASLKAGTISVAVNNQKTRKGLAPDQVRALRETCRGDWTFALVELALATGARRGNCSR